MMLSLSSVVPSQSTFGAVVELSDLDGSDGFVINGFDGVVSSGRLVSSAGDINGDGTDDFIIGSSSGESYVVFGKVVPQCNNLSVTVDLNFGQTPGPERDVVLGTPGNDDIRGRAGDDTICGMGGNDFIHGNSGNDWIDGGDGVDNLRGGGDQDTINGHDGDDEISGNAGADILMGGNGDDILRGGQGDDQLNGDAGEDFLSGGGGTLDVCDGGGGDVDLATASCEVVTNAP